MLLGTLRIGVTSQLTSYHIIRKAVVGVIQERRRAREKLSFCVTFKPTIKHLRVVIKPT